MVYCSIKKEQHKTPFRYFSRPTAALGGPKPNSRFKGIFSLFFTSPFFTSQTRWAPDKRLLSEQSLLLKIKGLIYDIYVVLGSDHSDGKLMDISSAVPCQFLWLCQCPIGSRIHGMTPSAALPKILLCDCCKSSGG